MPGIYDEKKVRVPYQPLTFKLKNLAKDTELIIDYYLQEAYILIDNQYIKLPREDKIREEIKKKFKEDFIGDMDYMTLGEFLNLVNELYDFMKKHSNPAENDDSQVVDTLNEIIDKFKNMIELDEPLIERIITKVLKEKDKGLSTHDYTPELKNKLANIEEGANRYKHPENRVCDFKAPIQSVNGKFNYKGGITITNKDIKGLENVEERANRYVHPEILVCNANFPVKTINGLDGDVNINIGLLEFDKLINNKSATVGEIEAMESTSLYVEYPDFNKINIDNIIEKLFD